MWNLKQKKGTNRTKTVSQIQRTDQGLSESGGWRWMKGVKEVKNMAMKGN